MKKLMFVLSIAFIFFGMSSVRAITLTKDLTNEIPDITVNEGFQKVPNVAEYKEADWKNVIGMATNISLTEAYQIANNNPKISFFFYTTGSQMVLERPDGSYRVFHHGDTVFFSGEPWWGSAPGLADGYMKVKGKPMAKDK